MTEKQADSDMIAIEFMTLRLMEGHQYMVEPMEKLHQQYKSREHNLYRTLVPIQGKGFHTYLLEHFQSFGHDYIVGWAETREYIYGDR